MYLCFVLLLNVDIFFLIVFTKVNYLWRHKLGVVQYLFQTLYLPLLVFFYGKSLIFNLFSLNKLSFCNQNLLLHGFYLPKQLNLLSETFCFSISNLDRAVKLCLNHLQRNTICEFWLYHFHLCNEHQDFKLKSRDFILYWKLRYRILQPFMNSFRDF